MRRLSEYLKKYPEKDANRIYAWVDSRSHALFTELEYFVTTKLTTAVDFQKFKFFLQWYLTPVARDAIPPIGTRPRFSVELQ